MNQFFETLSNVLFVIAWIPMVLWLILEISINYKIKKILKKILIKHWGSE